MGIPKIIHYAWFGDDEIPENSKLFMKSWRKYCPDYEIMRWDESNFNIEVNSYCLEAYKAKKYAFVSDYVRLYALINFGGIYLDTDVEVINRFDNFLVHEAFTGFESSEEIQTGVLGAEKNFPLFRELLFDYTRRPFFLPHGKFNYTPNVKYITNKCIDKGLILNNTFQTIDNLAIYPKDYFCPMDWKSHKLSSLSDRSIAIHHFSQSWDPDWKFTGEN